jgi:phosphoribosylaminoimidazole-succinocarboxamide synthase
MDVSAISAFADYVLREATLAELPNHYRGKVRDNYDLPDGRRILITTDRLSAFDQILTAIPLKGQVLTQTARFWFERTSDICPNHVLEYPDPNVVVCKRLKIMPVEIVVRDYLAGTTATSIWSMYKAGRREMYGHRFADGLRENQKLPQTIVTPTTKAMDGAHDTPLTAAEIVSQGLLTPAQWERASALSLALFARGRDVARRNGLILVDTKYEFGVDEQGNIVLADEIHTPDSSRYWYLESYETRFTAGQRPESFDKDFVRTWVTARCDPYKDPIPTIPQEVVLEAAKVYVDVFERITGTRFAFPDPRVPILERIHGNLRRYF